MVLGTAMTLEQYLASATDIFEWMITGVGNILTLVTSNPILLVGIGLALGGTLLRVGVGFVKGWAQ